VGSSPGGIYFGTGKSRREEQRGCERIFLRASRRRRGGFYNQGLSGTGAGSNTGEEKGSVKTLRKEKSPRQGRGSPERGKKIELRKENKLIDWNYPKTILYL